jgi:cell division protein FtsL
MNKMSELWYQARDAIDSGRYIETSTRVLRKYLAELSIVQPWESDQKCFGAVDKKHGRINKMKKEIERRKKKKLALARKTIYTIATGIAIYICGRVIYDNIFPENPKETKEQKQLLAPIQGQSTSNRQSQSGTPHAKPNLQQPSKK